MRQDRLQALSDQLATIAETTPIDDAIPPTLRAPVKLARRFGLDLTALLTSWAVSFLRSLPASASAEPERADRILTWASEVIAWLRGERDDPPGELVL